MADTQTDWLMQVRWYTRAEVLAKPSPIPRAAGVFAWWFHGLPNAPTTGCIEAKADEPIGEKIGQYWRRMKGREKSTLAPERIEALLKTVFGDGASPSDSRYCDLRYQLLTGVVGTLRQAEKDRAPLAVFVVHEFHTGSVRPRALATNSADYARFIEALFSVPAGDVVEGVLYGPQVALTGINATQVVLFIGKVAYEGSRSCG